MVNNSLAMSRFHAFGKVYEFCLRHKSCSLFLFYLLLLTLVSVFLYARYLFGGSYLIYVDYGSDSFGQSVPFFLNAADRFSQLNFSTWNASQFLGGTTVQLFNPEYIVSWFGRDNLPRMMCIFQIAKILLAGSFFYLFLGYFNCRYQTKFIFGFGIAFSGRMLALCAWTAYTLEVTLLSAFLWAVARVLHDKKKFVAFPITLALIIMTLSVYGLVLYTCILVMFTAFYLGYFGKSQCYRSYIHCFANLGFLYVMGIAISAPSLLPNISTYLDSARVSKDSGGNLAVNSISLLSNPQILAEQWLGFISSTSFGFMSECSSPSGFLGNAFYSSSVAAVVCLPFCFKGQTRARRCWLSVLLISVAAYVCLDVFRFLLGGGAVGSFDFRMSSVWVIFVLALCGAIGFENLLNGNNAIQVFVWICAAFVVTIVSAAFLEFNVNKHALLYFSLFAILVFLLVSFLRHSSFFNYLIVFISVASVLFGGYQLVNDVPTVSKQQYWDSFNTDLRDTISEYAIKQPARIDFQTQMLTAPMANSYMGTESYIGGVGTSSAVTEFMSAVGNDYIEQLGYSRYTYGFSDISLNAMLGVGYSVYSNPDISYISPFGYTNLNSDGYYQVYENHNSIQPISFYSASSVISDSDFYKSERSDRGALLLDALVLDDSKSAEGKTIVEKNHEALTYGDCIGSSPNNVTVSKSSQFDIQDFDGCIALNFKFHASATTSGSVSIVAKFYNSQDDSEDVLPVYLAAGDESVRIPFSNNHYNKVEISIVGVNCADDAELSNIWVEAVPDKYIDHYLSSCNERNKANCSVISFTNDELSVSIDAPSAGYLFAPIPYSANWRAFVDGTEVNTHLANLAFTSIKIGHGKHTVTLKYIDSTYRLGLTLFFVAIAILLAVKLFPLIVSYVRKGKDANRD